MLDADGIADSWAYNSRPCRQFYPAVFSLSSTSTYPDFLQSPSLLYSLCHYSGRAMPGPNYDQINSTTGAGHSPYGSGDPYYNESSGYITPQAPPKRSGTWWKVGIPVLILVVIGAVVGGVVGSRKHSTSNAAATSNGGKSSPAAASSAVSAQNAIGVFPTATDSDFMKPVYPSTVCEIVSFCISGGS